MPSPFLKPPHSSTKGFWMALCLVLGLAYGVLIWRYVQLYQTYDRVTVQHDTLIDENGQLREQIHYLSMQNTMFQAESQYWLDEAKKRGQRF